MAKNSRKYVIPPLSPEEAAALSKRIDAVARDFAGQFDELDSAIGMLVLGRLVGWKVLALIHNKRTIRKYEAILGINAREAFEETGPLTTKSLGFELAEKAGKFWKAVSGDLKIPERRELVD